MLRRRASVLAAVSGGPDSVALLAALVELAASESKRWRVAVAHVNHRLRGRASDEDQRFVERIARRLGVPVFALDGRIPKGGNLEERARERRYELLAETARRQGFRRIATGHTRDDQAETVLFRLLRGSGPGGLGGISPVRDDGVVRPLLDVAREEVLAFLHRRRLPHRVDRTNRSSRYTRNRIRRRALPMLEREFNPQLRATLARTAEVAREDERWLERSARRRLAKLRRGPAIDTDGLRRLPAALERRVLRLWILGERGGLEEIGLEHVEALRRLAAGGRGRVALPGGTVVGTARKLTWGERDRPQPFDRPLRAGEELREGAWTVRARVEAAGRAPRPTRWRAVFDLASLDGRALRVRTARAGDRIRPLGLHGTKKLQDVFVDAKVPGEERALWPILERGGTILWLPGLVRSDEGPVRPGVRRVLVVEALRRRGRK